MTALRELRCVPLVPMPVNTADVALRAVSTWLICAARERVSTVHPESQRGAEAWCQAVGQIVARLTDVAELTHAGLREIRAQGMLLAVRLIRPPRSPVFIPSYQPVRRRNEATRHAFYSLASAAVRNRPLVALAGVAHPLGRREAALAFSRVNPDLVPSIRRWPRPEQIALRRWPATQPTLTSIQL